VRESLMLACALFISICGFAWLALAMEPHWRQVRGDVPIRPSVVKTLRTLGAAALFVSLLICLQVDHPSMASLVWIMSLAASALLITFTLSWRPRTLAWLAAWIRT
jgi:hypothetical protein